MQSVCVCVCMSVCMCVCVCVCVCVSVCADAHSPSSLGDDSSDHVRVAFFSLSLSLRHPEVLHVALNKASPRTGEKMIVSFPDTAKALHKRGVIESMLTEEYAKVCAHSFRILLQGMKLLKMYFEKKELWWPGGMTIYKDHRVQKSQCFHHVGSSAIVPLPLRVSGDAGPPDGWVRNEVKEWGLRSEAIRSSFVARDNSKGRQSAGRDKGCLKRCQDWILTLIFPLFFPWCSRVPSIILPDEIAAEKFQQSFRASVWIARVLSRHFTPLGWILNWLRR